MSKYKWKRHKKEIPGFAKTSTVNRLLEMQIINEVEAGLNNALSPFIGDPLNDQLMNLMEQEIRNTLAVLRQRGQITSYTIEREAANFMLNINSTAIIDRLDLQINLEGFNSE